MSVTFNKAPGNSSLNVVTWQGFQWVICQLSALLQSCLSYQVTPVSQGEFVFSPFPLPCRILFLLPKENYLWYKLIFGTIRLRDGKIVWWPCRDFDAKACNLLSGRPVAYKHRRSFRTGKTFWWPFCDLDPMTLTPGPWPCDIDPKVKVMVYNVFLSSLFHALLCVCFTEFKLVWPGWLHKRGHLLTI